MTITDYLAARAAEPVEPVRAKALEALSALADAGTRADALLTMAERVKAEAGAAEAGAFEATVQTLGALSREAWAGHDAALKVTRICVQLEEVEARLREALAAAEREAAAVLDGPAVEA